MSHTAGNLTVETKRQAPHDHAGVFGTANGNDITSPEQVDLTEVPGLVVVVDLGALLGRPIAKDRALAAPAARQELAERMARYRWPAIYTARTAGTAWDEIDTVLHSPPGLACREYQTAYAHQKRFGLAGPDRHDPGPPEGPHL